MTPDTPDPQPDDAHWQQLNAALARLLDADADARIGILAALPPPLRARAQAALDAIGEPDAFDDVAAQARTRASHIEPEALIGQRIGDFELKTLLGVGGMSWVYLAERDQGGARQQVALKRLQPDLVSARLRARFLSEQRIVGRVAHPGIARLIAAGVDDAGVPWLATELVEGKSLSRWCDDRRLGVTERVRLFVQVCETVSAAHRHLIVHRDLKPGNVLVDHTGAPRLLDFGISRLLDDDTATSAPGDERTRAEWRMLTPEYAAPEQFTDAPASIAMDVYALGVMLYELLSGARPPTGIHRSPGEPPLRRPSSALTDEAAGNRGESLAVLRRRLRGDFDAVVAHALEYEPERRYARVELLADDLRAVLDTRPISLRRRHPLHTALRFVQRNWLATSLASMAVLVALGGVAAVVAESERREQALERAEAVEQFLIGLFGSASLSTRDAAQRPVSALLEEGAAEATDFAASRPALAARLLLTIAGAQNQLDQFDAAIHSYEASEAAARAAGDLVTVANAQVGHANVRLRTGLDAPRIDALLASALPLLHDHAPDSLPLAQGLVVRAVREQSLRRIDDAERTFRAAIELVDRVAPTDDLAFKARSDLGGMYELNGRPDDAVAVEREAWAGAREMLGPKHVTTLRIGFNLAKALGRQGALAEANTLMQETAAPLIELLPPDHTDQVAIRTEYARVAAQLDRLDEAEALLLEATALADQRKDIDGTLAAVMRSHLGALRLRQGKTAQGFADIDGAYRWFVEHDARDFFQTCWAQGTSARILYDLGRDTAAQERLDAPSNCGPALDEARARAAWAGGRRDEAGSLYAALLVPRDATPQAAMALNPVRLRYALLLRDAAFYDEARVQLHHIRDSCAAAGIAVNPELRQATALLAVAE